MLLDLVSFMLIDGENVGMHYPDFAFCHPLFSKNMQMYSDSKVSHLLNSIGKDKIIGFLNNWNKARNKKQRIYISYDSSNKNSQAGDQKWLNSEKPRMRRDSSAPQRNGTKGAAGQRHSPSEKEVLPI